MTGSVVAAALLREAGPEHESAFVAWLAERGAPAADPAAASCIAMVRCWPIASAIAFVTTGRETRGLAWDVPADWTEQREPAAVWRLSRDAVIEHARAAILLHEYSGTHFDREHAKGPDGRRSGTTTFSLGSSDLSRAYWVARLDPDRNWDTTGFDWGLVGRGADGPLRSGVARRGVYDVMSQLGTLASEPGTIDGPALLEGRLELFRAVVAMAMSDKGPFQLPAARSALALPFSGAITRETASAWREAAAPLQSLVSRETGPLADELDAFDALCTALGGGPEHLLDALDFELSQDRPRCVIVSAIADRWTSTSGRTAEAALRVLAEKYSARPSHDPATIDVLRSYSQARDD